MLDGGTVFFLTLKTKIRSNDERGEAPHPAVQEKRWVSGVFSCSVLAPVASSGPLSHNFEVLLAAIACVFCLTC
jgi:hypothetical protein